MTEYKNLLDKIHKGGLPTEIMAYNILQQYGFRVFTQLSFIDPVSNALRSIDLFAVDVVSIHGSRSLVNWVLYIECKKDSKKPIIFYRVPRSQILSRDYTSKTSKPSLLEDLSNIELGDKIAVNYEVLDHSRDNARNYFFEAQNQLLKAIKHNETVVDEESDAIFPIIVLNASMFEYYIDENGEDNIRSINSTNFYSNGISSDPTPTIIDVVHIDQFEGYLKKIKREIDKLT